MHAKTHKRLFAVSFWWAVDTVAAQSGIEMHVARICAHIRTSEGRGALDSM